MWMKNAKCETRISRHGDFVRWRRGQRTAAFANPTFAKTLRRDMGYGEPRRTASKLKAKYNSLNRYIVEWSDWGERHGRKSRDGSGEGDGNRPNTIVEALEWRGQMSAKTKALLCLRTPVLADSSAVLRPESRKTEDRDQRSDAEV